MVRVHIRQPRPAPIAHPKHWLRRRFAELAELRESAHAGGSGLVRALGRYASLVGPGKYSPAEIFMLGFLSDGGPITPAAFASKQRTLEAQLRINPRQHFPYTEDKLVFAQHCARHRLASPRVRAAIDPNAPSVDGIPVVRDPSQLGELMAKDPPCDLVLKPVEGVHGQGVRIVSYEGGHFSTAGGTDATIAGLMKARPEYSRWLLQERLHPHAELARLSGSSYLQTVRAVTLADRSGIATVPIAWLRIIAGDNVFDNFNFGASGNLVATVDLARGRLDHVLAPGSAHRGLVEAVRHPDTGVSFRDFSLPFAEETRELVVRAAQAFSPLRTIGWDVAITDDGPSLIEGNVTWDPLPTRHNLRAIVAALV